VNIRPVSESMADRQIQFDCMNYLMCSIDGVRRFCVAKDFVSLDKHSKRGVIEMIQEDAWPEVEKRRMNDILPKNPDNLVQHTRDALLLGSYATMNPPRWNKKDNPAA